MANLSEIPVVVNLDENEFMLLAGLIEKRAQAQIQQALAPAFTLRGRIFPPDIKKMSVMLSAYMIKMNPTFTSLTPTNTVVAPSKSIKIYQFLWTRDFLVETIALIKTLPKIESNLYHIVFPVLVQNLESTLASNDTANAKIIQAGVSVNIFKPGQA